MRIERISNEWLQEFFGKIDGNVLKRRESYKIEFKKEFNWSDKKARSKYMKSMAAYANNSGGLIIFGVEDQPHIICGVTNFNDTDDADISHSITEHFEPEIKFSRYEYDCNGLTIGIIQVHKCNTAPVVCTKDSSDIHSGTVYYRYNAKSDKIKASELRDVIDERIYIEQKKWMDFLKGVTKVGVDNIGLLDLNKGELNVMGQHVIIDGELVDKLKVIDEYSSQADGAPALKIVGEIREGANIIHQPFVINENDVFKAFLGLVAINDPIVYLKEICQFSSSKYPIWFLIKEHTDSRKMILERLEKMKLRNASFSVIKTRVTNDDKVIKALKDKYSIASKGYGELRKDFLRKLQSNEVININTEDEAKRFIESMFSVEADEIELSSIKEVLKDVFNQYYPFAKDMDNYNFRNSLAYIDYLYLADSIGKDIT